MKILYLIRKCHYIGDKTMLIISWIYEVFPI